MVQQQNSAHQNYFQLCSPMSHKHLQTMTSKKTTSQTNNGEFRASLQILYSLENKQRQCLKEDRVPSQVSNLV